GIEPSTEDGAGGDRVPATIPGARPAAGVGEGEVLRLPEPGGGGGAGAGAAADRGAVGADVRAAAGRGLVAARLGPGAEMPPVARPADLPGLGAGGGPVGLRHELGR